MNSDNITTENVVILDVPSGEDSPLLSSKSCSSSYVTTPNRCMSLTIAQMKKQLINRLEERTSVLFNKDTRYNPKKKCPDSKFVMPSVKDPSGFLSYKYSKSQLQDMARYYKLPVSGTVPKLSVRVYTHLIIQANVIPFQSLWRGYLRRKCNFIRGPALLHRSKCNNDEDFLTGETMKDIAWDQFVSYTTSDGFIYGFDIVSLYNLKLNSGRGDVLNPYTREAIPEDVFSDLCELIDIEKNVFKVQIDVTFEKPRPVSPRNMTIEQRVSELFSAIESHGYYPSSEWFMELDKSQLIRMLREIADIFIYRASIPRDVQMRICPENPFRSVSAMVNIIQSYDDIYVARDILLYVSCNVVMSGIEVEDRALGAIIFLQAMTLVSEGARQSFPLFYESASYS
jgi:hypothetical protein